MKKYLIKWSLSELKSALQKTMSKEWEDMPDLDGIFAKDITNKELLSKINKEHLKPKIRKQTIQLKNGPKISISHQKRHTDGKQTQMFHSICNQGNVN